MTPRQKRFVEEYLIDLNATQAALRAGFSGRCHSAGRRLLVHPEVAEAIAQAMARRAEDAAIDAAWVLRKAAVLHDKAMEAAAYAPAKGALDLIGKHVDVQAFREQVQHSGRIDYAELSDEHCGVSPLKWDNEAT